MAGPGVQRPLSRDWRLRLMSEVLWAWKVCPRGLRQDTAARGVPALLRANSGYVLEPEGAVEGHTEPPEEEEDELWPEEDYPSDDEDMLYVG